MAPAVLVNERTPILGGGNCNSSVALFNDDTDALSPPSKHKHTKYRNKFLMIIIASSLLVISAAAFYLGGLVTLHGNGNVVVHGSSNNNVVRSPTVASSLLLSLSSSRIGKNDDEDEDTMSDDGVGITTKMLFDKFMIQFNKSYPTNDEKEYRMKIFQDNINKIDVHNNNGTTKFKLGMNQFTDMTYDEIPKGFNKGQVYGKTAHNQFKETTSHLFSNVRDGITSTSTATASGVSSGDGNNKRKLRASVLPKSVDWRTVKTTTGSPVTTPVKDQGRCGSCWAFAATSVLESHIAIATNTLFSLSPQEFVSCTLNPNNCGGTGGCTGSTGEIAFDYVAKHGVVTEWENGYTSYNGNSGTCTLNDDDNDDDDDDDDGDGDDKKSSSSDSNDTDDTDDDDGTTIFLGPTGTNDGYLVGAVASIVGFSSLPSNSHDSLMYTVAMIGPVVVSVAANHWGMYQSGIFDDSDRNSYGEHYDINHAVVLEGYGTDEVTGDDYWLVRNSWGAIWGENGYIRLKRNDPSTLEDPMSICKTDNSPTHGVACTGPDQDITPPVELTCGTSGILYANVIPIGAHLL